MDQYSVAGPPRIRWPILVFVVWTIVVLAVSTWFQTYLEGREDREFVLQNAQAWIGTTGVWGLLWGFGVLVFGAYFIQLAMYHFVKLNKNSLNFFSDLRRIAAELVPKIGTVENLADLFGALRKTPSPPT
uniref:Uncharacterized protein n=1 Tax=viral metagenome TaxID=1070528 RepID=A0A6C0BQ95_9ZZZZ